jgi:hypothetical protein
MPGLISTAINANDPFSDIKGYDPAQIGIDPSDTVANQLKGILEGDSPLLQSARTRAMQESANRGLLNTSIAATAGEEALTRTALPIAQQDAATRFAAKQANQAASNQAFQSTAEAANIAGRQVHGGQLETSLIGTRAGAESGLQSERAQQAGELSQQEAIQQQAQARLQGEIQGGLVNTQAEADARLRELQGEIERGLIGERSTQQQVLAQQQFGFEKALQDSRSVQELSLQVLRGNQAEQIAGIEAEYKTLMQTNDSAARFFSQISMGMSEILKEPNITPEAKQTLIQKQTELLRNGLAVIGGISSIDLTGLLSFG